MRAVLGWATMGPVIADALLLWLVAYVGLMAGTGFILFVTRGFTGRAWSNRALLRASSGIAFILSMLVWLLIVLGD